MVRIVALIDEFVDGYSLCLGQIIPSYLIFLTIFVALAEIACFEFVVTSRLVPNLIILCIFIQHKKGEEARKQTEQKKLSNTIL